MSVKHAQQEITSAVSRWPAVSAAPHRFGGVEYRVGTHEFGHIHGDHLVDIPFPTKVRDEIVSTGQAEVHHLLRDSGWVSFYIRNADDIAHAVDLLQRSYAIAVEQRRRRHVTPATLQSQTIATGAGQRHQRHQRGLAHARFASCTNFRYSSHHGHRR